MLTLQRVFKNIGNIIGGRELKNVENRWARPYLAIVVNG
jgi:hypothetical protein